MKTLPETASRRFHSRRIGAQSKGALILLLALATSAPALAGSFLRDQEKAELTADTKATCIVAGELLSAGMGHLYEVKLRSEGHFDMTLPGENSALGGDGFAFVNVPKGPFRVSLIAYAHKVTVGGLANSHETFLDSSLFGMEVDTLHALANYGALSATEAKKDGLVPGRAARVAMPNELSGTCNGGFLWLGEFKGKTAGTLSDPSLALTSDAGEEGHELELIKETLKGTPWAAEVDKRAPNVPLPESQQLKPFTGPTGVSKEKAKVGAQVSLIGDGAAPKRQLRYAPAEGSKRSTVFVSSVAGPAGNWTLDTTAVKAADASFLRCDYAVAKSGLPNDEGITGFVQADDRGMNGTGEHHFLAGKAPTIGPPISAVMGVANTIVPLPEEPVGAGASWKSELSSETSSYVYTQTITYKLDSLEGDVAKISIAQTATTRFKTALQLPKGKMAGNEISGQGAARVNLGQLLPESFKLGTDATTLWTAGGVETKDAASTHADMTLEAK